MKTAISGNVPSFIYIVCALVGAFVGFFIPETGPTPPQHPGLLGVLIAFELNYINLIATLGAAWLLYWLLIRKTRGREAMIMYGALGLVSVRLIVASISYFRK